MTDDEARAPLNDAPSTGQPGERTRRSRRRGKRSKNRGTDPQADAGSAAAADGGQMERAAASSPPPRAGRKSAPSRSGYQSFNDGLDRFVCTECLRFLPEGYPVQHRRGVATVPLRKVDQRDTELLLCNGLHAGPCVWPDGVVVEPLAIEPAPDSPDESAQDSEEGPARSASTEPVNEDSPGEQEEHEDAPAAGDEANVMQLTESP